ncbi:hypothetical protein XENOCAPTIV_002041, partial [Xenoophorus captivus]
NISVTVKSHQLLAVIGPVGAGKVGKPAGCSIEMVKLQVIFSLTLCSHQSSLLSAILGELPHDTGSMTVKGQLTYASQQPWVFPGTIRSNILFGRELNRKKYERVLRACALKRGHIMGQATYSELQSSDLDV